MSLLREQFLFEEMLAQLGSEKALEFSKYIGDAFSSVQIGVPIQRALAGIELVGRHSGAFQQMLKMAVELIDQPDEFVEHVDDCTSVVEESLAREMNHIVEALGDLVIESLDKPCLRVVSDVEGEMLSPSFSFRARVSEYPADQINAYRQYEDQLNLLYNIRYQLGVGEQGVTYARLPALFDGGYEHSCKPDLLVEDYPDQVVTAKGSKAWPSASVYSFA